LAILGWQLTGHYVVTDITRSSVLSMSSVQYSINFSKNRTNTNLVDFQEQMNKSTHLWLQ